MKGVVLAGGLGKRLEPLTRITNKHLLPVYNRPMIFFPIQTLVEAGISQILIVTGGANAGDFLRLLGNGEEFGLKHLDYTYQRGEGGIADALRLAEHFTEREPFVVILGDNIIEKSIRPYVERFAASPHGAKVILKEVDDPWRFGVAELEAGRIIRITEKPKEPQSNYAVTGIYLYDQTVFDIIRHQRPSSETGELEITDVNSVYIQRSQMSYEILDGWWTDAGVPETLFRAATLVRERELSRGTQPLPAAADALTSVGR
jgi:glucose-1-phosphate thymidylyltransferase